MEFAVRKTGNSQRALIPKPILARVGLQGSADLQVRDGGFEIQPIRCNPPQSAAIRLKVGLRTPSDWRWMSKILSCGLSSPMRATPIWSGDEDLRQLVGPTRPDGGQRDSKDASLHRDVAPRTDPGGSP